MVKSYNPIEGLMGTEGGRKTYQGGSNMTFKSPEEAFDHGYQSYEKKIPRKKAPGSFTDWWLGGWDQAHHHATGIPPEE